MTLPDPRAALDPAMIEGLRARALDLADEARAIVRAAVAGGFSVRHKPDGSFVTGVDLRVEERLRALLRAHHPDHGIVGEEGSPFNPAADFQWIMDPVDGTEDLVHRVPTFGTILGLHWRGQPVVGVIDHPLLDLRVSAAYGLGAFRDGERVHLADLAPAQLDGSERVCLSARANFVRHGDDGRCFDAVARAHPNHRIYRSCLGHALAATGAADAAVDWGNRVWDLAASRILVEEAGGRYVVVRDREVAGVGRVLSAVFGKPRLVDRLVVELEGVT